MSSSSSLMLSPPSCRLWVFFVAVVDVVVGVVVVGDVVSAVGVVVSAVGVVVGVAVAIVVGIFWCGGGDY